MGSYQEILTQSWLSYKSHYIQKDGRVIDRTRPDVSTSEAQSYALLRAVWMNDRITFNKLLTWTQNNLHVQGHKLFAWKWGKRPNGTWGVLSKDTATDADQDIALALILTHRRWEKKEYKNKALAILKDIWDRETVVVNGHRYIVAGDWVLRDNQWVVHPSYIAPYAYRIFSEIDTAHPWMELVDSSYAILEDCTALSRAHLPPDQCFIDKQTGKVIAPLDVQDRSGDYSYESFRVAWRLALDDLWFNEPRALAYLKRMDFIPRYWQVKGRLPEAITPDGIVRSEAEPLSIYGANLPLFALFDPKLAESVYQEKLLPSFSGGYWGDPNDYYTQNWVWFGIGLYAKSLVRY